MFIVVYVGFAIAACLLFGHQFEAMVDVQSALLMLIFMVFTMDKAQFYDQMLHAAPAWIFHVFFWVSVTTPPPHLPQSSSSQCVLPTHDDTTHLCHAPQRPKAPNLQFFVFMWEGYCADWYTGEIQR
jgi:hypothetical protein